MKHSPRRTDRQTDSGQRDDTKHHLPMYVTMLTGINLITPLLQLDIHSYPLENYSSISPSDHHIIHLYITLHMYHIRMCIVHKEIIFIHFNLLLYLYVHAQSHYIIRVIFLSSIFLLSIYYCYLFFFFFFVI